MFACVYTCKREKDILPTVFRIEPPLESQFALGERKRERGRNRERSRKRERERESEKRKRKKEHAHARKRESEKDRQRGRARARERERKSEGGRTYSAVSFSMQSIRVCVFLFLVCV